MSKHHTCPSCGVNLTKARSPQDHRRLFAIIAKAFEAWPHEQEFQPDSADHLRAYLQCKAGHYVSTPIFVDIDEFPEDKKHVAVKLVALAVEAAVKAAVAEGDFAFTRIHGDAIAVFRPRSISWSTLDQRQFGPIREAIEHEIELALGVTCDQLLQERAA